jgi:hypothetical protein
MTPEIRRSPRKTTIRIPDPGGTTSTYIGVARHQRSGKGWATTLNPTIAVMLNEPVTRDHRSRTAADEYLEDTAVAALRWREQHT